MEVTVKEKFNRTAPRKLRLVANLIRGWQAEKALYQLRFIPKAAAQDLTKALQSALGAAKESNMNLDNTYIKVLMINEGPALRRRVYASRGRAQIVKKRMSHIVMTLVEKTVEVSKQIEKPENNDTVTANQDKNTAPQPEKEEKKGKEK